VPAGTARLAQAALDDLPGEIGNLASQLEAKWYVFNDPVWQTWNNVSFSGNSTASTASTGITTGSIWAGSTWQSWNVTYTTNSGQSYAYDAGTGQTVMIPGWAAWNTVLEETREQQEERERAQAEAVRVMEEARAAQAARQVQEKQEREAAQARAAELLRSLLTPEQWASYQESGWFEVRGSKGGRWRIRNRGQSGNVDLMPEIGEERDVTYCAHPPGGLPAADAHVAQMLALVTDEEAFVRTANVHYRRPGLAPAPERAEWARAAQERMIATAHERVHVGATPWWELPPGS
jgi:hypothetical protein